MTNPKEMVGLAGKVALVSGSTSGIGLGIVCALAAAGTHVAAAQIRGIALPIDGGWTAP